MSRRPAASRANSMARAASRTSSPRNSASSTMAQPKPKRAATAPRRPAAVNPDLHKLCAQITVLARQHRLGTVGLVGAHANGTALLHDATELFITVPFENAEAFAH